MAGSGAETTRGWKLTALLEEACGEERRLVEEEEEEEAMLRPLRLAVVVMPVWLREWQGGESGEWPRRLLRLQEAGKEAASGISGRIESYMYARRPDGESLRA